MSMSSADPTQIAARPTQKGVGRRWRDIALLAALFAFVIAGLAGLAAATGWEETKHQLMQLSLTQITILLALSLVNYLFRGARWHLFSNRLGLPTTLGQDLRHFLGGFAMSVTPGRVGELIRMRWLRRETGWAVERTAPLVLMDRASDLAAMALILAGGVALSAGGIAMATPVAIFALAAAFIATRPKLLAGCVTLIVSHHREISTLDGTRAHRRTLAGYLFKWANHGSRPRARADRLDRRRLCIPSAFDVDGRGHWAGQGCCNLYIRNPCWRSYRCARWCWRGRGRDGGPFVPRGRPA
ncbi:hypothetical protein GQR58_002109 [Nymphon striatum]|nr:hypothetical protein GQR58_002109 [Nymphon striatum]